MSTVTTDWLRYIARMEQRGVMKLWVVQPYAGACSDNVGTGSEKSICASVSPRWNENKVDCVASYKATLQQTVGSK